MCCASQFYFPLATDKLLTIQSVHCMWLDVHILDNILVIFLKFLFYVAGVWTSTNLVLVMLHTHTHTHTPTPHPNTDMYA